MKKTIFILSILFITTPLFACPNLEGEYSCTVYEPEYDITLENQQLSIIQDGNAYTINNDLVLIADERFHTGAFGIKHKTVCDETKDILSVVVKSFFVKVFLEYVPTEDGLIVYKTTKNNNKYISENCIKL